MSHAKAVANAPKKTASDDDGNMVNKIFFFLLFFNAVNCRRDLEDLFFSGGEVTLYLQLNHMCMHAMGTMRDEAEVSCRQGLIRAAATGLHLHGANTRVAVASLLLQGRA